jgi:dUTP pyrophosphatase
MIIKFQKLFKDTILPSYAHQGDAGMDLYSREDKVLKPGEIYAFKLGFALEIPNGYFARVLDRSGLAYKYGLHCLAGVVDAGYRGEYIAIIMNLSKKAYKIEEGERIAQMLILPVVTAKIKEVNELSDSERGKGGLGASGKK